MSKFKIGDKVIGNEKALGKYTVTTKGFTGRVTNITPFKVEGFGVDEDCFDLIKNNNNNNMTTLEKFALVFKSEPEKSFRKAGITNGDDLFTDEGQKIFLSWLLKKYGGDFKTEVVDPILAEEKE